MHQQPDPADDLDFSRLQGLLDMAGHDLAPELARRLLADLGNVAASLSCPVAGQDPVQLRAQSHILIALAGTIGAGPLTDLARDLNQMAHRGDSLGLARLRDQVRLRLERLLQGLQPFLSESLANK